MDHYGSVAQSGDPTWTDNAFSPKPADTKAVTIADPDSDSANPAPLPLDDVAGPSGHVTSPKSKSHRVKSSRKLSGRSSMQRSTSSLHSIASQSSLTSNFKQGEDVPAGMGGTAVVGRIDREANSGLYDKVSGWLREEQRKRASRKSHTQTRPCAPSEAVRSVPENAQGSQVKGSREEQSRSSSESSDGALPLDKLEQILKDHVMLEGDKKYTPSTERRGSYFPRRRPSSIRKLRKGSTVGSSDSEYQDGDVVIPTAEVILDNSKTLAYTGGAAESDIDLAGKSKRSTKDKEGWIAFKNEIVRLAHTLRLKGWRSIPLERGADIEVVRLSGALTNAVYVVSPPKHLPDSSVDNQSSTVSLVPSRPPPKLLLRIYGPQVEHLIDRENELQILRRLARKKIGPRLLGTFLNGRFEEFFHARTLTAHDLRIPETSTQIAKRMRELHDGVELLEEEREAGAFVWRNWDKWVERCEEVISWIDRQILPSQRSVRGTRNETWKERGLICGVKWSVFRETVERYRQWLDVQYGGPSSTKQHLVFAHNDTQYGNLLRLEPSGESPLLLPANEHKQLVVIDFEYASANVPGLEFANHFTEWCYNYHDPEKPYALRAGHYPTPDEQRRFIKAYVQHRPQFQAYAPVTPGAAASPGPSSSISSFMLDSRAPPAQVAEEERRMAEATETEVQRLMHETRIWRVANSAQWVAWGVVQAKVPGMEQALERERASHDESYKIPNQSPGREAKPTPSSVQPSSDPLSPEMALAAKDAQDRTEAPGNGADQPTDEDEGDFDYLGYAHERAMFFWGDLIALGVVRKEELPADLLQKVKLIEY